MTSFANCGDTQQTLLILLLFAALLLQYLLVIENAVARRYVRSIPDSLLFLSELCLLSMLLAVEGERRTAR